MKWRIVQCAGITAGKFQTHDDEACGASKRPEDENTCFERPCFKWYTTPWSEVNTISTMTLFTKAVGHTHLLQISYPQDMLTSHHYNNREC